MRGESMFTCRSNEQERISFREIGSGPNENNREAHGNMLQPAGRLLVVAHDELSPLLRYILESEGYKTIVSPSMDGVPDVLGLETINLIILDDDLLAKSEGPQSCCCDFIGFWSAPAL